MKKQSISKFPRGRQMWLPMLLTSVLLGTGCNTPRSAGSEPSQRASLKHTFSGSPSPGRPDGSLWKVGRPMVWYMQGPGAGGQASIWGDGYPQSVATDGELPRFEFISPAVAKKLADGGFNMMFVRNTDDLDWAHANGMRGMLYVHEGEPPWRNVLHPDALDDPAWLAKLDVLIDKVKNHPAMYGYISVDEPGTSEFPAYSKLVDYVRKRDPKHLFYINLFPTYASPGAQGTSGDKVTAYREYLHRFITEVKPDLISYDHYHMKKTNQAYDGGDYFLNLVLVREATLKHGLPFMNVVQAASMGPGWRTPNADEGRFLAYTTLAYGGQGICQFVYNAWDGAEHWGGIENPDRSLTPLGIAAKQFHREFVAIGEQLQPLTSIHVHHLGGMPNGAVALPADAAFTVDPRAGYLLFGYFGSGETVTHVLVVNLNYTSRVNTTVVGPAPLQVFDAATGIWHAASDGARAQISMEPGGGKLLRLR